jgi:DNA-directed RNA polymerase subunit RPC12/RpoP
MAQTEQYQCRTCGKTFPSQRELNEHEKNCK